MGYQSEAQLEKLLISTLELKHKYDRAVIQTETELESNFRNQLNNLNKLNLENKNLTDKEFERVLIYMNIL